MTDLSAGEIVEAKKALSREMSLEECLVVALNTNASRGVARARVALAEAQHRQSLAAYWPQLNFTGFSQLRSNEPNFMFPGLSVATPAMAFTTPEMNFQTPAMQFAAPGGTIATPATTINVPASALFPNSPPMAIPVESQQITVPGQSVAIPSQKISVPRQTLAVPSQVLEVGQQEFDLLDRWTSGVEVDAKWLLFDGGERSARKQRAKAGIAAAKQEMRRSDIAVVADVKRYYEAAVLSRALVTIGEDVLVRMESTLELTRTFYEGGSMQVTKMDYLRNKIVVDAMRSFLETLRTNYELACSALTFNMGLEWSEKVEPNRQTLTVLADLPALPALVHDAYQFNPDWNQLQAGLEAAEYEVKQARAAYLPKVALTGSIHAIDNGLEGGLATDSNMQAWSVGVGVEVPLFNGFLTKNRIAEAKAKLEEMKSNQILLREGLGTKVKKAFLQLSAAQRRLKLVATAAESATENRSLTERAYRAGMAEADKVFESLLMDAMARASEKRVQFEAIEAKLEIDITVGSQVSAQFPKFEGGGKS
ncbi:MAG: TolC family protein [Verrucomicrobiales bacterium]